jgi:cation:H+ antiporter
MLPIDFTSLSTLILSLCVLVGLVGLVFGGDVLTKGAVQISFALGIPPVIVGLTIISIATSMPELAASLTASADNPGLALGNIQGSNIANIGLILGIAAIITPLPVSPRLLSRDVPLLLGITVLFTVLAYNGLGSKDGAALLGILAIYLIWLVKTAPRNAPAESDTTDEPRVPVGKAFLLLGLGAVLLGLGADLLVGGAVNIASRMGVSDAFIGLTVVALGTSLPELAASIAAVRAGQFEMCVGNVVGSNIFNILLIGGTVSSITPISVPASLYMLEFPVLVLLTFLLLPIFRTQKCISRLEGVLCLSIYLGVMGLSTYFQSAS